MNTAATPAVLDRYLPWYSFRHRHTATLRSNDLARVFAAARELDLSQSWIIRTLFRLRGLPTARLRAAEFAAAMGWTTIAEAPPHEFVIGYWRSDRIEPVRDRTRFALPTARARQKVAFSFRFRRLGQDRIRVETETRVWCIGRAERRRFQRYWLLIHPFSALIRREVLRLIRREAEAPLDGRRAA